MLKKKYLQIWDKIRYEIENKCDSEQIRNDKYIKAKVKSYNCKIAIDFHGSRISKDDSRCIGLSIILIDSVFKIGKYCYP